MTQDLTGRTFLVTGAGVGIGLATARGLAVRGGRAQLARRPDAKGKAAVAGLAAEAGNDQIGFLPLDLARVKVSWQDDGTTLQAAPAKPGSSRASTPSPSTPSWAAPSPRHSRQRLTNRG